MGGGGAASRGASSTAKDVDTTLRWLRTTKGIAQGGSESEPASCSPPTDVELVGCARHAALDEDVVEYEQQVEIEGAEIHASDSTHLES